METEPVVVFRLGETFFGLDAGQVREILVPPPVTRVPGAPRFVRGVINLRGAIVPVIDLVQRLGLPGESREGGGARIVVVEAGGEAAGFLVDAVTEVASLNASDVEPAERLPETLQRTFTRAIARLQDRLVVLLSPDRILLPGGQAGEAAGRRRPL